MRSQTKATSSLGDCLGERRPAIAAAGLGAARDLGPGRVPEGFDLPAALPWATMPPYAALSGRESQRL